MRTARLNRYLIVLLLVFAGLALVRCKPSQQDAELPPVKTPLGVHLVCQPPKPETLVVLYPLDFGRECGLTVAPCNTTRTIVFKVDERGEPTEIYVPSARSRDVEKCLLAQARTLEFRFAPARECNGDALPGEYTDSLVTDCGAPEFP